MHHHHHCAIAADTKPRVSVPNRSEKQEPLMYVPDGMTLGFLAFLPSFLFFFIFLVLFLVV